MLAKTWHCPTLGLGGDHLLLLKLRLEDRNRDEISLTRDHRPGRVLVAQRYLPLRGSSGILRKTLQGCLIQGVTDDPVQIRSLGPKLADFLDEFADCFGRSEPRGHLASYVLGKLSDLPRKSVSPLPISLALRDVLCRRSQLVEIGALIGDDRAQVIVARDMVILTPSASSMTRAIPSRATRPHVSRGNGAATPARSTTASSLSTFPTPPMTPDSGPCSTAAIPSREGLGRCLPRKEAGIPDS